MTKQTWDLNALTLRQRDVLGLLCNTNDGATFLDLNEPNHDLKLKAARQLAKLGLIEVDEPRDGSVAEVGISLTEDGEAWLLSLPEGSLTGIDY